MMAAKNNHPALPALCRNILTRTRYGFLICLLLLPISALSGWERSGWKGSGWKDALKNLQPRGWNLSGGGVTLAPHQASYTLSLVRVKSSANLNNITGKMAFRLDDTCDAWKNHQSMQMLYSLANGENVTFSSDYRITESKNRQRLRFAVTRKNDGEIDETVQGAAIRNASGKLQIRFLQPVDSTLTLTRDSFLPNQHTREIIRRFNRNDTTPFTATLFDGSESGTPQTVTTSFAGNRDTPTPFNLPERKPVESPLLQTPRFAIQMAWFKPLAARINPDYRVTMWLHTNGVVEMMRIDYDDFSLLATLDKIEAIKMAC